MLVRRTDIHILCAIAHNFEFIRFRSDVVPEVAYSAVMPFHFPLLSPALRRRGIGGWNGGAGLYIKRDFIRLSVPESQAVVIAIAWLIFFGDLQIYETNNL